jgi:hypothetical protein
MNPDSAATNSFGSWLKLSRNELILAGYPATTDESQMQIITLTSPVVTSITPYSGFTGTEVVITDLQGSGFQDGAVITLSRFGQPDITMTGVTITPALITGTFDLTNATAGQWNVTVTNPYGLSDTLANGFMVRDSLGNVTEIGVYGGGMWYIDIDGDGSWSSGDAGYGFGAPGWTAVLGDWDGSGVTKIGVYRDGMWYLDIDGDGSWSSGDAGYGFGAPGWLAVLGAWG